MEWNGKSKKKKKKKVEVQRDTVEGAVNSDASHGHFTRISPWHESPTQSANQCHSGLMLYSGYEGGFKHDADRCWFHYVMGSIQQIAKTSGIWIKVGWVPQSNDRTW